jgi:hypothetical protein
MKEPESDLKHVPELMATYLQILQPVSASNISLENAVLIQTKVNKRRKQQLTVVYRSPSRHGLPSGSGSSLADSTTSCSS